RSATLTTAFYKIDSTRSVELKTDYAKQYSGGGSNALIDGMKGGIDFRSGAWQGYENKDVVAIVDLGEEKSIQSVHVNFLQDQDSWIFYPTEILCYISTDNKNFELIGKQNTN